MVSYPEQIINTLTPRASVFSPVKWGRELLTHDQLGYWLRWGSSNFPAVHSKVLVLRSAVCKQRMVCIMGKWCTVSDLGGQSAVQPAPWIRQHGHLKRGSWWGGEIATWACLQFQVGMGPGGISVWGLCYSVGWSADTLEPCKERQPCTSSSPVLTTTLLSSGDVSLPRQQMKAAPIVFCLLNTGDWFEPL